MITHYLNVRLQRKIFWKNFGYKITIEKIMIIKIQKEKWIVINMHIPTIEEDYEYRMENIMQKFVKDYELEGLSAEELQDKIWSEYAEEFAHAVLQDMTNYSGDELFEIGE